MTKINANTPAIIDSIGGVNTSNSAKWCLAKIAQDIMVEIRLTARQLNGVWDDDAQKIFMESLERKSVRIQEYVDAMMTFLDDVVNSVNRISEWDALLASKLSDPQLKG